MVVVPKSPMNVDDDLAWAQSNPGRYELSDGEVIAMSQGTIELDRPGLPNALADIYAA